MQRRNLPEDLIEEILSRVPARSSVRLRSMSKRWNSLLKSRGFAKIHYANSPKESLIIMLVDSKVYLTSVNLHGSQDDLVRYVKVATQFYLKDPFSIRSIFHCDGLLLCTTMDNRLVVWNPCSGETKWIKPRNNYYKELDFYALGYDNKSSCKKYKILRVDRELRDREIPIYDEYEIYDLTTDSWRVLGGTSDWYLRSSHRGVSVKGNSTYLVAFDSRVAYHGFILSFDFSTERFRKLPLPHQCSLAVKVLSAPREDQLCLCFNIFTDVTVWMTTIRTGSVVSWSKLLEVNVSRDYDFYSGVSFLANEQNKLVLCCNKYIHEDPHGGNLTRKLRCSLLLITQISVVTIAFAAIIVATTATNIYICC